jgi:phytoene dehydrogenase-like protein
MIAQHFFANTPTFFALSYFGLYLDYSYPRGGTGALARKMTEYIRASGGEVRVHASVAEGDGQKRQIRTEDGEVYGYKKLIWAADQKTLYRVMRGLDAPRMLDQRRLAEEGKGGDSILTLFMGVDLYPDYFEARCGAHAFYTPTADGLSSLPKWQEADDQGVDSLYLWIDEYLERTTYEISCPALRDEALAPPGKTGVVVSTLMDYRLVRHIRELSGYAAFKEFCVEKITQVLGASLFPDIREHMDFALCATPLTIERETGNAQGAITGWAFTGGKPPAENRFKKIAKSILTPMENILQCGQWSFSPSGLPVSILTGKLAADAVRKTWKGAMPG